jgi:intracellular septation protein A
MKLTALLVSQLLPLLVFVVVDSLLSNERISIVSAIVFAAFQLATTYAKTRRFDWFVLLDAALICALGAVSIAFDDDIFFKMKPVIGEGVSLLFMLVLIVAPDRFLLGYFRRMAKGSTLTSATLSTMKAMLALLCSCTAAHIGAVLYTAFYSSRRLWAIVAGPGFYAFLIPTAAVMLAKVFFARRRSRQSRQSRQMLASCPVTEQCGEIPPE